MWNWTLSRQGLHPDTRLASATAIADASLGLHAARLPSPYATALARATAPDVALTVITPRPGLTTLRCMRKTLHLLPLDLAAAAHAATAHYRLRDAERLAHNAGVARAVLDTATRSLLGLLHTGPAHHRVIESTLAGPRLPVAAVRIALKLAWERGTITYLNQSGCWNAERRAFALTSHIHPDLDTACDPAAATLTLVSAYFDRYGPATVKDVMWWSALSRTAVLTAMNDSDVAWVALTTPWSPAPAYLPADRWEEFLAADPTTYTTGLNLLAHEDVALKAYFETRSRYLGNLAPRQAFNQIGEVLPTVLVDGQVRGTWAWQPHTRSVVTTLIHGRRPRGLTAATDAVTDALRSGWHNRPTPTRRTSSVDPSQLSLAI